MTEPQEEVVVLVPAAGQGTRLGGRRKQYRELGGQPVVVQTLRAFERHPEVHHIVVAAPAEGGEVLKDLLQTAALKKVSAVVPGGDTRQASVERALHNAPSQAGIVLIHDAVRPFICRNHVSAVIEEVRREGAAALALPVSDTVRRGNLGQFAGTVPRRGLYRMQTPQGFWRLWLEEAHAAALRDGYQATDDVDLVQRRGYPIQIVPGDARNMKITTPGDWEMARTLWPSWSKNGAC